MKKHVISTINGSAKLVNLTNESQNFKEEDVSLTVLILENLVGKTSALNEVSKIDSLIESHYKVNKNPIIPFLVNYLKNISMAM